MMSKVIENDLLCQYSACFSVQIDLRSSVKLNLVAPSIS